MRIYRPAVDCLNLSKAGWSLGYVSAVDSEGRTIWIADAHRSDGKRFIVRANEKLATFVGHQEAHAITGALETLGVIKIVSKGKAGLNSREAAEFRYLLSQSENGQAEIAA